VTNDVSTFRPGDAKSVTGELIDPRLADVEALARWMDYAFVLPGGFRFGLAGVIGLIPGIGDVMDALISLYIVNRALQLGIPRVGVARMVLNVGIEGLLGAAPFVGNLFDVVFKANRRNYVLLNSYLAQPRRQHGMGLAIPAGHPAGCNCWGSAADLAPEPAHPSFGIMPPRTVASFFRLGMPMITATGTLFASPCIPE
jgi:Domain of unknown function (DUF4112)